MPALRRIGLVLVLVSLAGTRLQADPISWLSWSGGNSGSAVAFSSWPGFEIVTSGSTVTNGSPAAAPSDTGAAAASSVYSQPTAYASSNTTTTTGTSTTAAPSYDGFINLGSGPYPNSSTLATGSPQPWYDSAAVDKLYGGVPTAQQQADFASTVLQRVEQTFQLSGVPVSLTTDPTASAAHTLSVVSNSSSIPFPDAIGTSTIGQNGFSYIDQIAKSMTSVDQLETVVAHNVAHELMLTFGVPEKYDQTGNYIDATNANWSMITSPSATFSQGAADALNQALQSHPTGGSSPYAQDLKTPEPATLLLWAAGALAVALRYRGARNARQARSTTAA